MSEKTNKKKKIKYIIIAIHALLTLAFAPLVFENVGVNPFMSKVVREVISSRGEIVMSYIYTEITALVLVFLFWNFVFKIFSGFKKSYITFLIIFVVGTAAIFLIWPEVFTNRYMHMHDNLTTFSAAIRLTPDYWHSFYLSVVYAAAMLFLPVRFSITLMQWAFFVAVLAYVFHRAKNNFGNLAYLIFLFFLFPNASEIMTYAHRICMYVILLALFTAIILFDIYEKKKRSVEETVGLCAFAAFLCVWRSEGIIFCAPLFIAYLIAVYKKAFARIFKTLVIFASFFAIISIPQKVGDEKYYGKDYSIMNSFENLYYIFNASNADLEYKNASNDLQKIEKIVPVGMVKEFATEGYRNYNVNVRKNYDLDQSAVSIDEAKEYMAAYKSVLAHNPLIIVKLRINWAFETCGLGGPFKLEEYTGEKHEIEERHYYGWDVGYVDYYQGFINKWRAIGLRDRFANKVFRLFTGYRDFTMNYAIYGIGLLILVLTNAFIAVKGIVSFFKKKDCFETVIGAAGFFALAAFAAIIAVMPVPSYIYFYSTWISMMTVVYIFGLYAVCSKKHGKGEKNAD